LSRPASVPPRRRPVTLRPGPGAHGLTVVVVVVLLLLLRFL
jgi:hypothetical protein